VEEALRRLEGMGATLEEVSIPGIRLSGLVSGAGGSDRTALQWKHLPERWAGRSEVITQPAYACEQNTRWHTMRPPVGNQ